jgi:ABC-type transport system involved in cytochrome c biogenesis permease component
MALSVATERDDGSLKRLRATPMPSVAYFLGKVGLVGVTSVLQTVLLLVVATLFFDVELPTDPDRWAVFVLVFALGVFSGTVLGIAYSSLATSRSIGAVVIGPMLVLQFISGVYRSGCSRSPPSSRSSGSPRGFARSSSLPRWRPPRWQGRGRPARRPSCCWRGASPA